MPVTFRHIFILIALGIPLTSAALAAGRGESGGHEAAETVLIGQVILLILIGRGLGEILQRLGQPAVIGSLLAGLILGPSLFGWVWPDAYRVVFPRDAAHANLLTGLADVGVLMLLLLTGMEVDLRLVRKVGRPAVAVTATGIAVPFLCGFILGQFLPAELLADPGRRLVASLFLGTALSISPISCVVRASTSITSRMTVITMYSLTRESFAQRISLNTRPRPIV